MQIRRWGEDEECAFVHLSLLVNKTARVESGRKMEKVTHVRPCWIQSAIAPAEKVCPSGLLSSLSLRLLYSFPSSDKSVWTDWCGV